MLRSHSGLESRGSKSGKEQSSQYSNPLAGFNDINFDDEDDIKDLIYKLKKIYEDHWKIFNRINTSIKLPIFVKLDSDDNLKVSNFEKILNEINLVYDYFVLKFDKNHIYYQIIFNGTPNIFLKLMKDKNFVFSTQNKTWILQ